MHSALLLSIFAFYHGVQAFEFTGPDPADKLNLTQPITITWDATKGSLSEPKARSLQLWFLALTDDKSDQSGWELATNLSLSAGSYEWNPETVVKSIKEKDVSLSSEEVHTFEARLLDGSGSKLSTVESDKYAIEDIDSVTNSGVRGSQAGSYTATVALVVAVVAGVLSRIPHGFGHPADENFNMADPIGITGTAVGIVSFGLQLYTGVSEYLDAVKGREEDLRQANTYAKTLWTSLKSIEDATGNIDSHRTIPKDAVEECKVSCEIELKSLDSLLKDLRGSPVDPTSLASSAKSSMRKLSYPFKKKSITKLEEKLNSTNNVLKIALLALQLRYEICRCAERRRLQRKKSRWGPIFFDNEVDITTHHAPECPFSRVLPLTERKTNTFGISIPNMLGIFKSAVHVSMSLTSGAGGLSLAQNITWTATVDQYSSPAFRIINAFSQAIEWGLEIDHYELIAKSCMRRLELCYANHEASPGDINKDGQSVFENLISSLTFTFCITRWPIADIVYVFRTLAAFKVPITHSTRENARFVSYLANDYWFSEAETPHETIWAFFTCCDDVIEYEFNDNLIIRPQALRLLKACPQIAEFLGYNPLSMAVLREDEDEVRFLLDKFPSYNWEVNFSGQSPVHIAVQLQNTSLVSLLLKYVNPDILNTKDNLGRYPIDYAFHQCIDEADLADQSHCDMSRIVELLLESNSVILIDQLSAVFQKSCKLVKTLTLKHLAKRRKELEQLAVSHLPSAEIRSLGLCKGSVLDWNAVNVQQCLAAYHCNTPSHLLVVPVDDLDDYFEITESVYAYIFDRETAEFAFSMGFDRKTAFLDVFRCIIRQVKASLLGSFPYSLSYVGWLVDGGTQLQSVIPLDFKDKTDFEAVPPSVADVVVSGSIRDECLCHCSLHGCSPLSKYFEGFELNIRFPFLRRSSQYDLQTVDRLLDGLQMFTSEEELSCSWIFEAVLRHLTFSTLELRHTCCVLGHFSSDGYLDPEEINEIHEEDFATLQLLERLVAEFQADCGKTVSLGPFLRDRWLPKMREVLEEIDCQRLTEEELRKAEDDGVIWEQDCGTIWNQDYGTIWNQYHGLHHVHMNNLDYPAPPEKNMMPSSEMEPEIGVAQARQSPLTTRKRSVVSTKDAAEPEGLRKARKVSRACDFCKSRKAKCSGDQPCAKCAAKGFNCSYDSKYTRGRPPTPPLSEGYPALAISKPIAVQNLNGSEPYRDTGKSDAMPQRSLGVTGSTAPSRASPELSIAEIQGQVFDPTSGLTFLHRALKRLSKEKRDVASDNKSSSVDPMTMTGGDKALTPHAESDAFSLPEPAEARLLLSLYFDVCIATYRILHKPTIESWLSSMERNMEAQEPVWKGLGRAKAAIVLVALAIASLHRAKSEGFSTAEAEDRSLTASDTLFTISIQLADEEKNLGYPKLETAQAKLIQVLYLLTTSRFNRAWYMFGNTLQLVSALGLHRRVPQREKTSMDYIRVQCGIRTFWTVYILDNYLGVIFGRPRHYHDDDIDQSYPDRIDDDDMTSTGPQEDFEEQQDCSIDALIFHAKCTAANTLLRNVHEWHASLPVHLGSIRPSMLIPSYRRQATVLKLAHSHAIMHANRLFLLGSSSSGYESQINECIDAAKTVLQSVDHIAQEGPIFHAFWWTHYVTFCALMVTYAWEAQQRRAHGKVWEEKPATRRLLRLAERCQMHLANATESNSPSRRYAVILEELRTTASLTCTSSLEQPSAIQMPHETTDSGSSITPNNTAGVIPGRELEGFDPMPPAEHHLFDEWNTMDWLALDSSAFWPYFDGDADGDEITTLPGIF
ncbi:hypothetical protein HG530_008470 [Fusarium avenaceum]|nr:hypothetical protein HG530_008470 [Fusarium avenaceum]